MSVSNALRQFTKVISVATVVPASTSTVDVELPPGAYNLALAVKSSVTGTTTTVAVFPWVDIAASQIGVAPLDMVEPDDSAPVAALTLPAGAAGRYASLVPSASANPVPGLIVLPRGVRVTITKGTAVTGELLEILLVANHP